MGWKLAVVMIQKGGHFAADGISAPFLARSRR